jgi:putative transposase
MGAIRTSTTFTDDEIASILLEEEAGTPVRDICRRHGISELTYYRWRGRSVRVPQGSADAKVKAIEEEVRVLRRLLAFQALDVQRLRERIEGKTAASPG